MSCINIQAHLSQIAKVKKDQATLYKNLNDKKITIADFFTQKSALQKRISEKELYFSLQDLETHKLGAVLRERLNLKSVSEFREGYAIAQDWDNGFFHINTKGEKIYENRYTSIRNFCENVAAVKINGEFHYITPDGKQLPNTTTYAHAENFSYGLARVGQNSNFWFINKAGEKITEVKYGNGAYGLRFSDGLLTTYDKKDEYYFMRPDKTRINDKTYTAVLSFSNERAAVQENNKEWFYIDKTGTRIQDDNYRKAERFSNNIARVCDSRGNWFYITKDGSKLNEQTYEKAGDFENGIAWVYVDKKYHLIKTDGTKINEKTYDNIQCYKNGLIAVNEENVWYFINSDGEKIDNETYETVGIYENGTVSVTQNKTRYFIDANGKKILKQD